MLKLTFNNIYFLFSKLKRISKRLKIYDIPWIFAMELWGDKGGSMGEKWFLGGRAGGICPGGICPGGVCPVGICPTFICPWGIFPEDTCPPWFETGRP